MEGRRMMKRGMEMFVLGVVFGIILTKSEVVSWFRIQEMFLFGSVHMYGIIGSAIVVGALSMAVLKRLHAKSFRGEEIVVEEKPLTKGTLIGGLLFGVGWALTGACPGPIYALVGNGYGVFIVTLASAVGGTFVYGVIRDKLPH